MSLTPNRLDYEDLLPNRRHQSASAPTEEVWNPRSRSKSEQDPSKLPAEIQLNGDVASKEISPVSQKEKWVRSHGHTLSFAALFIFSVILYFRPYELIPALSAYRFMAFYSGVITLSIFFLTQVMLEGNLTARPKEVNLALLFGLAALLSIPLAINPAEAWETCIDLLIKVLLIFIVMVNVVRNERRLNLLLLLALAVSAYLSIKVIQDYQLGVFTLGNLENNNLRVAGRIRGLFENSNDLAMHLVTMTPIAIGLALTMRGVIRKVVLLAAAALMSIAVILTFSRGGFLGLIASSIVLVIKLGRRHKTATTAAVVFGIILFLVVAPGSYSGRLSTIFDSTADLTGSSSQRTQILKRSVLVALRYPLFGVGIGNFHYKSVQELVTHNAYTQVAAEMGIPALIVYIMFLLHPIRRLRKIEQQSYSQRHNNKFYYLSVGLQASLVGYMVSSFFGAVAYQWYVYYLVSYAICLHRLFLFKPETDYFPLRQWEHPFSRNQSLDREITNQALNEIPETAR